MKYNAILKVFYFLLAFSPLCANPHDNKIDQDTVRKEEVRACFEKAANELSEKYLAMHHYEIAAWLKETFILPEDFDIPTLSLKDKVSVFSKRSKTSTIQARYLLEKIAQSYLLLWTHDMDINFKLTIEDLQTWYESLAPYKKISINDLINRPYDNAEEYFYSDKPFYKLNIKNITLYSNALLLSILAIKQVVPKSAIKTLIVTSIISSYMIYCFLWTLYLKDNSLKHYRKTKIYANKLYYVEKNYLEKQKNLHKI